MDMIKKIHKIPDKVFFNAVFLIVILWNLKYFFLPLQVPFTMIAKDFIWQNQFYSAVEAIKNESSKIEGFQDEGQIGFVSDIAQNSIFDLTDTIKSFYIAQYAIVLLNASRCSIKVCSSLLCDCFIFLCFRFSSLLCTF